MIEHFLRFFIFDYVQSISLKKMASTLRFKLILVLYLREQKS